MAEGAPLSNPAIWNNISNEYEDVTVKLLALFSDVALARADLSPSDRVISTGFISTNGTALLRKPRDQLFGWRRNSPMTHSWSHSDLVNGSKSILPVTQTPTFSVHS